MYKVLLVDDEPLILAGIKFMIDWEQNGCDLVGTARNGKQALQHIEEIWPDIVIADINMPVMNGMELLRAVHERYPEIVFIMLTNLQEFDLVQEALRMHAFDYITKIELDPKRLEDCLTEAKQEVDERRRRSRMKLVNTDQKETRQKMLESAVRRILAKETPSREAVSVLEESGFWKGYAGLGLCFEPCDGTSFSGDIHESLKWEMEVVHKLARGCFAHWISLETALPRTYLLMHWGDTVNDHAMLSEEFARKLKSTSQSITALRTGVLITEVFYGEEDRTRCHEQLAGMVDYYYNTKEEIIRYAQMPALTYETLQLEGIPARLKSEINSRNMDGCRSIMERVIERVLTTAHRRSQGIQQCGEIYRVVEKSLVTLSNADAGKQALWEPSAGYLGVEELATREDVITWLEGLLDRIDGELVPLSKSTSDIIAKATQYVRDNVEKRITLQDAADFVCLSPGYFSALFKKECGMGFVDLVNQTKMERACELIQENQYRISEISFMLSFQNAYYFSKVFRRHMGMSPTEYRHRVQQGIL